MDKPFLLLNQRNRLLVRRFHTNVIFPLVILVLVVVTSGCIGPGLIDKNLRPA
jgi:hypothetical protein